MQIEYDLSAYLPENMPSIDSLALMQEEFAESIPNLSVVAEKVNQEEALLIQERLKAVSGVLQVNWLDAVTELGLSIDQIPDALKKSFYQDSNAKFLLAVETDDYDALLNSLRESVDHPLLFAGQAVDLARASRSTIDEMARITLIAVPLALAILVFFTTSYFEPILFLVSILIGVLLNMGSNFFLGKISFITQSVGAVLQLAVSTDYGIFVLHRFGINRREGMEVEEAMIQAILRAFSSVTSSALTTLFGFLALVFMKFRIGPDMGIVLAKGIVFSLLSVLIFLPALTLLTVKLVDKSTHKSFLPSKERFIDLSRAVVKIGPVLLILMAMAAYPLYQAQRSNTFLYGMGSYPAESIESKERSRTQELFGENQQVVLLVPKGDSDKEVELNARLKAIPEVEGVLSYAENVGTFIPEFLLPQSVLKQLRSENYSRFVLQLGVPAEGPETFAIVETLRGIGEEYYGEEVYWLGMPFSLADMKQTITDDDPVVNGLAIISIAIVLLINFRSLALTGILLFCIEFAIWANLSVPYYMSLALSYIGYLVISTMQLGATVDYAILNTQFYLEMRVEKEPKEAALEALAEALPAILPPATILAVVGYILNSISSIPIVAEIGRVLGRGAIFSMLSVVLLLPNLLRYLDPLFRHRIQIKN